MALDVSGVSYFLPLFSFLIVFIVSFAVLVKTKVTDKIWLQLFIALLIAVIFVSFGGARKYIENVVPWVAVLLVSVFLLLMFTGLFGKISEKVMSGAGVIFIIIIFLIFLISAYLVFSSYINPYLPWSANYGSTGQSSYFVDWISAPRIGGGILLAIVAAIVAWVLVKVK